MAIAIDQNITVHDFVAGLTEHSWVESVNRLHGLSAELDTGGIHFAVVLVLTAWILGNASNRITYVELAFYWLSFIAITVIGNMIARTTLAGTAIGLVYLVWKSGIFGLSIHFERIRVIKVFCVMLLVSLPLIVYSYNTNHKIRQDIRFGFEGFFSLVEKGKWDVASNNTLKGMVVYPQQAKTWLFGDGYIVNPKSDPYYTGNITKGYYMNTDIGYLRFIFYFGLPGLIAFSVFIIVAGLVCARRLPRYKSLIVLLVVLNFIVWMKVSTDLFFIFALLYSVDAVREDKEDELLSEDDIVVYE